MASPRNILPSAEESFFLRCLQEIIMYEKDLEVMKINLSLREDFNLIDAFGILDEDGKGNINPQEMHVALRKLEIMAT
jgi:Ca2+-binding EF-hand superfamily protein